MKITAKTRTSFDITGVSENTAANLTALLAKGNFPEAQKTGLYGLRVALEDALANEGVDVPNLNVDVKRTGSDGHVARYIVSK